MGIDAEMFARIKGRENWLKPEDERHTGYELASTIGPEFFYISMEQHALSIIKPDPQFGRVVWLQDGDPIIADADEQFVEVHIQSRYYGPGYARGNWPAIRIVAEWLEWRFPSCEVWYGGDSSGVCASLLDAKKRKEINDFFLATGRRTYTRHNSDWRFSELDTRTGHAAPKCPCCDVNTYHVGGGNTKSFWQCDGCGRSAVTDPTGVTWSDPR